MSRSPRWRTSFAAALDRSRTAPSTRYLDHWQRRLDAELTACYRRAFPRRKLPVCEHTGQPTARKLPRSTAEQAPGYTAVSARYEALVPVILRRYRAARKTWDARLDGLAQTAAIERGDWRMVWDRWRGTYSTQTQPDHYAKGAAEADADVARHYDVPVEVRPTARGYEVHCPVSELGAEVLRRRPGPSLRESVRLCWRRGINPRVLNPYLPAGYEARAGLDYAGREK